MPHKDAEERKKYDAQYRKKHREERKAYIKGWKDKHPDYDSQLRAQDPKWLEKSMWRNARKRAKAIGLNFDIDLEDVVIPITCPLLPTIVLNRSGQGNYQLSASSPTIDRIDNLRGYVKGNVWVISWRANTIKNDASLAELEQLTANLKRKIQP